MEEYPCSLRRETGYFPIYYEMEIAIQGGKRKGPRRGTSLSLSSLLVQESPAVLTQVEVGTPFLSW